MPLFSRYDLFLKWGEKKTTTKNQAFFHLFSSKKSDKLEQCSLQTSSSPDFFHSFLEHNESPYFPPPPPEVYKPVLTGIRYEKEKNLNISRNLQNKEPSLPQKDLKLLFKVKDRPLALSVPRLDCSRQMFQDEPYPPSWGWEVSLRL